MITSWFNPEVVTVRPSKVSPTPRFAAEPEDYLPAQQSSPRNPDKIPVERKGTHHTDDRRKPHRGGKRIIL